MITSKKTSKAAWSIVLVLLIIIGFYFVLGETVKLHLTETSIKVNGIYGTEIEYNEIDSFQELNSMPITGIRTNGIGLGFMNLGHFSYAGIGNVILYQLKTDKPFILITTKNQKLIYAFGKEENQKILEKLKLNNIRNN